MPANITVDRGHPVVDPATLAPGTVVKVIGSVPLPYRRALLALGLKVTTTDPDGLVGTTYQKVVGAVVYNEKMVSFGELVRAARIYGALIPMANITPGAPTCL